MLAITFSLLPKRWVMSRLYARYSVLGLFLLLMALPSWCQKSGTPSQPGSTGSAPSAPSSPSSPGQPNSPSNNGIPTQQPGFNQPQYQSPLFVRGRVVMETGQPVPEPVSIALRCGVRPL